MCVSARARRRHKELMKSRRGPYRQQAWESWEEPRNGTAPKPLVSEPSLCQYPVGLGSAAGKEKPQVTELRAFYNVPASPALHPAGVNPQKMGLEAVAARGAKQGEESPAGQRQGEKAPRPGENRANSEVWGGGDHAGLRGARGPEGAAERRRAHTALPAEPRPLPPALAFHLVQTCRRGGAADAIPTMLRGVPPPSLPPPLPLVEEDGGRRSGGPGHPAF